MKIKKITKENYVGKVYNIGTNNRNYFAELCLVHNCYQDSTKEGKHASLEEIKNLVKDLRELEVFEVALGGGEPTLHPDFIEILSLFHENQIVPNFTTFNMAWTKNQELAEAITYFCKSFAISTLDIQNLEMLKEWNSQWTWNDKGPKGTLQIPLGVYPKHKMEEALKYCVGNSIPITFLGFKKFGRGTEINPADSEWIFSFIKEHNKFRPFSFGGDTLFVNQFRDQLKKLHVHEVLMVGEEGKFSMYIDAVEKTIGPSSYVDERYPYSSLKEDILSRFPFNE